MFRIFENMKRNKEAIQVLAHVFKEYHTKSIHELEKRVFNEIDFARHVVLTTYHTVDIGGYPKRKLEKYNLTIVDTDKKTHEYSVAVMIEDGKVLEVTAYVGHFSSYSY